MRAIRDNIILTAITRVQIYQLAVRPAADIIVRAFEAEGGEEGRKRGGGEEVCVCWREGGVDVLEQRVDDFHECGAGLVGFVHERGWGWRGGVVGVDDVDIVAIAVLVADLLGDFAV